MAEYDLNDDMIPVFMINGFLEAGKTQFLQFTMAQDYFQTEGKTLLIVCEEGDTEYDEDLLKRTKTSVVYIDDPKKGSLSGILTFGSSISRTCKYCLGILSTNGIAIRH